MADIAFTVLGPMRVYVDGHEAVIHAPRQRTLLAVLLTSPNQAVSVDRLIDAIWADNPPGSVRAQIQICVSALRRLLGDAVIATRQNGYQLTLQPDQLDAVVFDDLLAQSARATAEGRLPSALRLLDDALDLWKGSPFEDVPSPAVQLYAQALTERRAMATEERIELRLQAGQHRQLIDELYMLTAQNPLREQLWGFLMLALYRSGRQAEALNAYRTVRASLIDELGIEPSERLRELERAVLTQDPGLEPAAAVEVDAAPAVALLVPRQLPPDLADFTGRADMVDELRRYLVAGPASDTLPLAVITGPAGFGKTSLAVHVGHQVLNHFPDGTLFCQMHGTSASPRSVEWVMGFFLRSLGLRPDEVPVDRDERAALLRTMMAGRRLLVILDDVGSEEQVAQLLPALEGPAVLLTGRSRLAGLAGSRLTEVGTMPSEEAVALLDRISGDGRVAAAPESARELAELCAGLPIALRLAGVRLSAHPHWPLRTLLERLKDERFRLDELSHGDFGIRTLLNQTYHSLNAHSQQLFCLLSLLDLSRFTSWNAAALMDSGLDEAAVALDEIADARLLDVHASELDGEPHYRFHDLVRIFAKEQADALLATEQSQAAVQRVLGGMLALAEEAVLRLHSGNHTALRGTAERWVGRGAELHRLLGDPLAWFDAERGQLETAVEQAAALGLDELCWELATTAVIGYEAGGWFDEWRHTHRVALEATQAAGNLRGQAALLTSLGSLGIAQHTDDDLKLLEQSLALFEQLDDGLGKALAYRNLAHLERMAGNTESAIKRYERSLEFFRQAGDVGAQSHVLNGLARTYLDLGQQEVAESLAQESLTLARKLGNRRLEAQALCRLGEFYLQTDQVDAGHQAYQQALTLTRLAGDRVGQCYAQNGLGLIHLCRSDLDSAEVCFTATLEICRTANERTMYAEAVLGLGRVAVARGECVRAEHYLSDAASAFEQQGISTRHRFALQELHKLAEECGSH